MILGNSNNLYNIIQKTIKDKNNDNFAVVYYCREQFKITIVPNISLSKEDKKNLFLQVSNHIGDEMLHSAYSKIEIIT